MYPDLTAIEEDLAALVASLDPAVVSGPDALVGLERACRITKLATTVTMLLGKRVHETDAWKPSGKASAAHLFANLAGISTSEAMSLLGTAKKMAELPKTDDAARQGKLSGKQAGEVTKGAAADPSAEDDLLDLADNGSTAELADESKRRRLAAAGDDERRHARMKANRALHRFSDDDGSAVMRWRHLPEVGAELDAILSDYIDDEFHDARREGRREQRCAYAADGLVAALRDAAAFRRGETIDDDLDEVVEDDVIEIIDDDDASATDDARDAQGVARAARSAEVAERCAGGPFDLPTADTPASDTEARDARERPAGDARRHLETDGARGVGRGRPNRRTRRRNGERSPERRRRRTRSRGADAKVIVRIDHAALLRGHTEPGEICDIAGIGPVPVTSVIALMDDAFLAAVVTKGRDVCTVAHLGRAPNAYQQTAKQAEGMRCAVLGCPNTRHLERDHEQDWAWTHHTRVDELDWLCPHHHDLKTHHRYRLEPGRGRRALLSPAEQQARGVDLTRPADADRPAPGEQDRARPSAEPRTSPRAATQRGPAARPEALTLDL